MGGGDTGDKIEISIEGASYGGDGFVVLSKDIIQGYWTTAVKVLHVYTPGILECVTSGFTHYYFTAGNLVIGKIYPTTGFNGDVRFHMISSNINFFDAIAYLEKY